MASHSHSNSSNKPKPWPTYFIVRTTGEVVPLIGVDELPIGVDLVGVPRAIDLEDTIGMLNLGIQRSSETYYKITQQEEQARMVETVAKLGAFELEKRSGASALPHAVSAPSSPRSASSRPFPETQICRHWCTYGICKWGRQCRYMHVMPMTFPGLQKIGLNDWPQWYRALNPGHFAGEPVHLNLNFGRRGTGRGRSGRNRFCDGMDLAVGITHARAERLRTVAKPERATKKAELRERTLRRVSELPKESKDDGGCGGEREEERAAIEDAKDWQEDGSEVAEETKEKVSDGKKTRVGKTSLLD